jgi:hypothetical protein
MPRKYENGNAVLNRNYTKVENEYLNDPNLRAVEMGILTKLLSLPPNFKVSIQGIAFTLNESPELIRKSFKNLIKHGYMKTINQNSRDNTGKFAKNDYCFSGKPIFSDMENEEISETEIKIVEEKSDFSPCLDIQIRKTAYGNPDMENQIRKTSSGYPYLENQSYTSNNNSNSQNSNNKNSINNHFVNNHSITQTLPKNQSDGESLPKQKSIEINSFITEKIELESIQNGDFSDDNGNFYNQERMKKVKLIYNTIFNTFKISYEKPNFYYNIKDCGKVSAVEMREEMQKIDRILLDFVIFQIEDRELIANEPIRNYEAYARSCIYRALKNGEHKIWSENYCEEMGFYWSCWDNKYSLTPDITGKNNEKYKISVGFVMPALQNTLGGKNEEDSNL